MAGKCTTKFYQHREEGAEVFTHQLPQSLVQDCSPVVVIPPYPHTVLSLVVKESRLLKEIQVLATEIQDSVY